MKDTINQMLDKFSPYQFFCNLLPGVLIVNGFCYVTSTALATENLCETFVIFYFYGVAVSRIASIIVEPGLKRLLKIKFTPYTRYLEALFQDMTLADLMREANMFRALLTCSLILLLVWVLNFIPFMRAHWSSPDCFILVHALVLIPVFALAYRKQCKIVKLRVLKLSGKK